MNLDLDALKAIAARAAAEPDSFNAHMAHIRAFRPEVALALVERAEYVAPPLTPKACRKRRHGVVVCRDCGTEFPKLP